eukprot:g31446.t1
MLLGHFTEGPVNESLRDVQTAEESLKCCLNRMIELSNSLLPGDAKEEMNSIVAVLNQDEIRTGYEQSHHGDWSQTLYAPGRSMQASRPSTADSKNLAATTRGSTTKNVEPRLDPRFDRVAWPDKTQKSMTLHPQCSWLHLDLHARVTGEEEEFNKELDAVYGEISSQVEGFGFFDAKLSGQSQEVFRQQLGVLRTNCFDSLDRTNLLQVPPGVSMHESSGTEEELPASDVASPDAQGCSLAQRRLKGMKGDAAGAMGTALGWLGLSELALEYPYEDLASATNGFHADNRLGAGGVGAVYKGKLRGATEVRVLCGLWLKRTVQFTWF